MKTIEKILILVILIMMVLPAIQKELKLVSIKKLEGDFVPIEKPTLSFHGWMTGEFQTGFDKYLEENIGFRSFLVRFINQIDFALFRTTHAEGVIVGKNGQLFEYDYIRAYTGIDFIGEENIDRKIRKLKFIQEHLKNEKNIDLILVFEPGKTSYYSEFIPQKYIKNAGKQNNYNMFIQKAMEYNVRHIDFNAYFTQLKEKTSFPLYPASGTHWSTYGMSVAADSLIRYIEKIRQINLPEMTFSDMHVTNTPDKPDYDIASTLNLLCHLPKNEQLAYPVFRFEDNPDHYRPMVLAIADSYYWNIFNAGIPKNIFKNEAFWYFYGKAYPETYFNETLVKDLNLRNEIENQDIILLMVTERFLHKLGWGFIEDAYALYGTMSRFDTLHNLRCSILNYYIWFSSEIEKARVRSISLEKDISLNADYLYSQEDLNGLLMLKGPEYFESQILNNRKWLKEIQKKAIEQDIPINEMIRENAIYTFQNDYPDSYQNYLRLQDIKEAILADSLMLSKVNFLAGKYYLTFEEAMQAEAERIFDLNPEEF